MKRFSVRIKNALRSFLGCHEFKCVCCGRDVFGGVAVCPECMEKLEFIEGNACSKCGKPAGESEFCGRCGKRELFFDRAWSALVYDGAARKAMLAYKFGGYKYIANTFAKFLADKAVKENIAFDAVTYVPLTQKDRRKRGYNQTRLLAEKFCDILDLPPPAVLLEKTKQTEKQEKLDFKERAVNLKGAFAAADKDRIKGGRILIIDDVLTTGATASECAKTLKKCGADKVFVLTVATRKETIKLD